MTYQKALKLWLKLEQRGIPAIMIKKGGSYHLKKLTRFDVSLLALKVWDAKYGFGKEKA